MPRLVNRTNPTSGIDPETKALMQQALQAHDIRVDIPVEASLEQVQETLALAVTGYRRLSEASEKLKPIIGRILLTVEERRLFAPRYKNFTAFVRDFVMGELGFSRSSAFDSLKIARAFPSFTTEEYQRYGASRLLAAARVTNEQAPEYRTVLDESTRITVDAFLKHVKAMKPQRALTSRTVILAVRVPPELWQRWKELLEATQLAPPDLFGALLEGYKPKPAAKGRRPPAQPQQAIAS